MKHKPRNNAAAVTNRLGKELSPYLLQHAGNPVDWYPWGDEAFVKAREEDKPIFLSIGYSACHWCHVMERESFEDEEVALVLNDHFVSIKVDREELPDVDEVYMNAVQMTTGSGGWPLNVFLMPDLKPFFGGTYFPPQGRYGLPGFKDLLVRIAQLWEESRQDLLDSASQIVHALQANPNAPVGEKAPPAIELIARAVAEMNRGFDPVYGGFGQSPKFPPRAALSLLMRYYHRVRAPDALKMITLTLDRMDAGGIFDHIGGGFHRYSTDEKWLVPHFEKMLYDNALLSKVYAEAYQLTHNEHYRQVAQETLDYVLREMRGSDGGFYSSEDADSEGMEGKYYVWRSDEIADVLGNDATFFARSYGITREGNFESFNILSRLPGADDLEDRLSPMRLKLRQRRDARVHPGKDDKVIASWNAMMIEGLVAGYKISDEARYREAAIAAGEFVWHGMRAENGRLLRIFRAGIARQAAYLDDYANVVSAFEAIYEITFDPRWLEQADLFAQQMIHDFWDETSGAFFMTSSFHASLPTRLKPTYDGATPSGNSVAAMALMRLSILLDRTDYWDKGQQILKSTLEGMRRIPQGYYNLMCALDYSLGPRGEIALAGADADDLRLFLDVIHARYLPNSIIAARLGNEESPLPVLHGKSAINGMATAWICRDFTCGAPVSDAEELARLIS